MSKSQKRVILIGSFLGFSSAFQFIQDLVEDSFLALGTGCSPYVLANTVLNAASYNISLSVYAKDHNCAVLGRIYCWDRSMAVIMI